MSENTLKFQYPNGYITKIPNGFSFIPVKIMQYLNKNNDSENENKVKLLKNSLEEELSSNNLLNNNNINIIKEKIVDIIESIENKYLSRKNRIQVRLNEQNNKINENLDQQKKYIQTSEIKIRLNEINNEKLTLLNKILSELNKNKVNNFIKDYYKIELKKVYEMVINELLLFDSLIESIEIPIMNKNEYIDKVNDIINQYKYFVADVLQTLLYSYEVASKIKKFKKFEYDLKHQFKKLNNVNIQLYNRIYKIIHRLMFYEKKNNKIINKENKNNMNNNIQRIKHIILGENKRKQNLTENEEDNDEENEDENEEDNEEENNEDNEEDNNEEDNNNDQNNYYR
jgi:hypothetical protein